MVLAPPVIRNARGRVTPVLLLLLLVVVALVVVVEEEGAEYNGST